MFLNQTEGVENQKVNVNVLCKYGTIKSLQTFGLAADHSHCPLEGEDPSILVRL